MLRIVLSAAVLLSWTSSSTPNCVDVDAPDIGLQRTVDARDSLMKLDNTDVSAKPETDQPMVIVGIADGVNKKQGHALTWALKRTLDASVEWKSIEIGVETEKLFAAAQCPETPDTACLARLASKMNLSKFVWGSLKLRRGRVTARLGIFDREATVGTAMLEYSANMIDTFDEDLLRLANSGLMQLLGPIHFPVLIRSREPTGSVVVDDVVIGQLSEGVANLSVTAGDHRFRLVLPDATVIGRSFQVRVEAKNHIRLDFINIPET
jgi:hypothetical protein